MLPLPSSIPLFRRDVSASSYSSPSFRFATRLPLVLAVCIFICIRCISLVSVVRIRPTGLLAHRPSSITISSHCTSENKGSDINHKRMQLKVSGSTGSIPWTHIKLMKVHSGVSLVFDTPLVYHWCLIHQMKRWVMDLLTKGNIYGTY